MSKKLHARVIWRDNMIFEGDMEGHTLIFDGYGKAGPSPMEVLLASVGACTAKLIKRTLHATHQEYSGLEVKPEGEKTEEPPEVFRQIQLKVKVSRNVNLKNLERAVDLVERKYFRATVMIQNGGVTLSNISEVVQTQ